MPLEYPFRDFPEPGYTLEVAAGIFWVRMPLPFSLDHVNLWILKDGCGWVVIDTGLANKKTKELWQTIEKELLKEKPVNKLIVTHLHPDHFAAAGYLCERWQCPLYISRSEYFIGRAVFENAKSAAPHEALKFYESAGFDDDALEKYRKNYGSFANDASAIPNIYKRLNDNDELIIDGCRWRIITGSGHSPEHCCLLCEEKNIFIAGDQLIPNITSNVSVWSVEPDANPLKDWLESCNKLLNLIPNNVLVLPGHGLPFSGTHQRLNELIKNHDQSLDKLYTLLVEPKRVIDVFDVLFKRKVSTETLLFATGESIAHLNYLMVQKKIIRINKNGVYYYQQNS